MKKDKGRWLYSHSFLYLNIIIKMEKYLNHICKILEMFLMLELKKNNMTKEEIEKIMLELKK